jgi:hypothetical protein
MKTMSNRFGRYQKHAMTRSLAERALEARMESAWEREERRRSREELGLELKRHRCRHGKDPEGCPLCRDWTAEGLVPMGMVVATPVRLAAWALFGVRRTAHPLMFG